MLSLCSLQMHSLRTTPRYSTNNAMGADDMSPVLKRWTCTTGIYMGRVDRNDQLRQYYHVRLKSCKFYRYIFWFLFEICLANAHILYQHYSGADKLTLKEFQLEVAQGLIGDYNSRKRAGRYSHTPSVLPLRHFPVKYTEGEGEGSHVVRDQCWLCHTKHNKRTDNQWWCQDCRLHLCHTGIPNTDCFLRHYS